MVQNTAFVFIKPHAVTEKVKALVKTDLAAKGFKIESEGSISAEQIDQGKLIDQHYYAIASKATILKPAQLNVPADKFKAKFGLEWADALKQGVVYNAMDACEKLGVTADELDKIWGATKKADLLVKFGGGFYCGKIALPGKDTIYAFNGFFMSMRQKFVAPGTSIYYYVVSWDSKNYKWEEFRGDVLGPTDPATAPKDSLRGKIMENWKALGLTACPDTGDNGVHASASPFEALAERMNWLGVKPEADPFGKIVLQAIPKATVMDWSVDPQVTYGPIPMKASLFDSLEDTDSDKCAALMTMIAGPPPLTTYAPYFAAAFAAGAALAYFAKK